jgi:hypothetical protein
MSANFVGEVRNASSGELPRPVGRLVRHLRHVLGSGVAVPRARPQRRGGRLEARSKASIIQKSARYFFSFQRRWVSGRSAPHGLTPLNRCRRFASTVHDRCDDTPGSRRGQVATCARDSCNTRGRASASSGCGDAHDQPAQGLPERVDDGVNVPIRAELVFSTVVLGDRLRLSVLHGRRWARKMGRSIWSRRLMGERLP